MNGNSHRAPKRRWRRLLLVALVLLGATAAFVAQNRSGGQPPQRSETQAVAVTAAAAVRKTVPVQLTAIGTVDSYASVSIKSRISGQLVQVHFREGQEVSKGDLLFTIDPRPHEVALKEAQARLAKDKVLAEKAEIDARRYADLAGKDFVSKDKFEQFRANAAALKATLEGDRAAVENARLQLSYCYIRAPLSGRTGSLLVDEGSQIKANDDRGLVDITQIAPIYVSFSVPQKELGRIQHHMHQATLPVEAFLPGDKVHPVQGSLTFLDNRVSSDTGTIRLKATFANGDRGLWPGQFVDVVLTLTTRPDAIVVPSEAIQTGQEGLFVFIIKPDLTVESRPVAVAMTLGSETVLDSGVLPGEQVVTDGQLRLVPGSRVQIRKAESG
ncbi:MAG: efflux RND transporter periplasmic adaptor subunit [Desulfobacterales bacterium]|nr:MAG: efflux RND transporter periplasmic adaptor subunit [Desulfobacterales bacterium]